MTVPVARDSVMHRVVSSWVQSPLLTNTPSHRDDALSEEGGNATPEAHPKARTLLRRSIPPQRNSGYIDEEEAVGGGSLRSDCVAIRALRLFSFSFRFPIKLVIHA